jgi:hypothetical protein
MTHERTYGEEEVAEIFKAAAAHRGAGSNALAPMDGFTLAELQAIGNEVGLAPERVAEAAAAVDIRRGARVRSDLGMPVSVGRSVELPRALTDREWEMLVADLRETFGARGRVGSRGDVREWTHGNLHAYVEPTPTGYRLRLGTTKGNALASNRAGGAALAMALLWLVVLAASGALSEAIFVPLMMALMGGGMLGFNALRLPGWAQERETQMEAVAARACALLSTSPAPELPAGTGSLVIAG